MLGVAAECHFIHYNKGNSGLSYNGIRIIKQDTRGYIWVGTHKGLSRYDGTRFKIYDRYDFGVESDYICALEEDVLGNIWIGTDNGVVIYDYRSDSFHPLADWIGSEGINDRIFSIASDSEGNIWIGTRASGLFKCNPHKKEFRRLTLFDEKGNLVVNFYRIVINRSNRVYVAVYCDNIYRLDVESDVLIKIPIDGNCDFFCSDDVEGLAVGCESDDILYLASKRYGLTEVNVKAGTVNHLLSLSNGHRPTDLRQSAGRYLWLGSTEGLYRYDLQSHKSRLFENNADDRFSLSDNYVTTSCVDKRGGLWIGTLNGGVNYHGSFQDNFRKYYKTADGLSLEGCIVRDFAEDISGNVWIATEQLGLLKLEKENTLCRYVSSLLPKNITALCDDVEGLWIGTQNGISRLAFKNGDIVHYPFLRNKTSASDNRIVSIFRSREGVVYAGTAIGVLKYNREKNCFSQIPKLENLTIEHMAEDVEGRIWMASYSDGVFVYNPIFETLVHYCVRHGNNQVPEMTSSMCIDDEQILVISFSSGIFRYEPDINSFAVVNKRTLPTLPTDVYFSAVPDGYGNIWLTSDNGLVKYNPDNGLIKVFTTDDGLLDMNFKKSALTLSNGSLLFGSENGFICFDPATFNAAPEPVKVLIADMSVKGESRCPTNGDHINVDVCDELHFAPSENSFGFSFATPDVSTPTYGRLLCRLDGYDTVWKDVSTSKIVEYYNVPAGKYRFQIKTITYDASCYEAHKEVKIVVEPKFWESPEGITLFIVILLILMALTIRNLHRRAMIKEKRKQEEHERVRDAELYRDKITFFSNVVHEIKTPLTLIKSPLQQILSSVTLKKSMIEDVKVIENSTDYLDKLTKELLEFIRIEKHGYNPDIRTIDLVDKLNFLCFNFIETAKAKNVDLQYHSDVNSIYIEADESACTKMLNNLLHNAVKYAESVIDVHIYFENNQVVMTLSNDGPTIPTEYRENIFKPFVSYSNDVNKQSQNFGIGLSLARTFAEMHHGTLVLDADSECTKFVLSMPGRIGDNVHHKSPVMNMDDYIHSSTRPLIVLAEDNMDLSSYLKRKLEGEYRVVPVSSAEQALELLKKYDVDLLITDIALPKMSGVELCQKVSSDFEISHVSIVVVSAISTVETKIKCMDSGATIYIEKPFSLDYFLSCVRNILDKRDLMRTTIATKGVKAIEIEKFALPDIDEEFIRNLDNIIMENLQNPDFSSKQLENLLFLSHSTLNRKMKALFNTTPNDYLRTKRLAVAAHLLESEGRRVNEICRAVGFPSASYFSKCFKEQYGVLPIEYRARFVKKG